MYDKTKNSKLIINVGQHGCIFSCIYKSITCFVLNTEIYLFGNSIFTIYLQFVKNKWNKTIYLSSNNALEKAQRISVNVCHNCMERTNQ